MNDALVPAIVRHADAELANLAKRINAEHSLAEASAKAAVEHAHTAGQMLIEAKGRVQHGEWLDWLKNNTELTARTAQRYMAIARRPKSDKLSFLEALNVLSGPSIETVINQISEDGEAVINGFRLTTVGLEPVGHPSFEQYAEMGKWLLPLLAIGQAGRESRGRKGELAAQIPSRAKQ